MKRYTLSAILFSLGLGVGMVCLSWLHGQVPLPPPPVAPAPAMFPKEITSYRDLVKAVLPAVVSIDAKGKQIVRPKQRLEPFAEEFPKLGFGSGVFIDAKGVILTNNHVVEGAESVTVTLYDGRKFTTKDIRVDTRTDLAIVVLDEKQLAFPALELGDSSQYEIGDRVLAVGAPFGLTGTVTHGILSGKGRNLNMNMYEDFLQTDAAINPGNSGGPLIAMDGKVVGINAAIKSRSGGFQGIGLAVSSNLAKSVAKALQTDGVVKRGYLGIQIRELTPEAPGKPVQGVLVGQVFDESPAAKAGMKTGDILVSIDEKAIRDGKTLQHAVANLPINKAATFEITRDGQRMTLEVTIEEQPKAFGTTN